jgi:hypothetical protein
LGAPIVNLENKSGAATLKLEKELLEETRTKLPFLKDGDGFILM